MHYLFNKMKLLVSKRSVKHITQYVYRGFSDKQTWSLDYSLAKLIHPRLKRFNELRNGHPGGLSDKEWDDKLQKMIAAFEFAASEDRWDASQADFLKHQEGINLFAKYYFRLWW